ncbi:P-type conjugative transfer protein TrbG [Sphingomonas donggukensis]|uniref:P-type conjugative transfer protein TrbG n=1 Tax=Sphingomonas donggukensis TaxID=2949093 RepID=A0ABY4TTZ6_9SPHN|nr:P-type conjugative transfer protein TrbG [Sphingomonas donggukensis]URW75866.1 P-type conjugative transfer protein TrbG [Sphingomonas donggukensis]
MNHSSALVALAVLAGCTAQAAPPQTPPPPPAAVDAPSPAPPIEYVAVPTPLPLPGQLKPAPTVPTELRDPRARVAAANGAARVEPSKSGWINAVQVYPFSDGALYQVYAAPGQVTDLALEPGEQLIGTGPVAAGDTVRWVIGDTVSGSGPAARVHILLKPVRVGLATNLVINTDRRTYHVELSSAERTYMASVSWIYPQDQLIALKRQSASLAAAAPATTSPLAALDQLHFGYRIEGDRPPWRPLRAFDDGRQVMIEFSPAVASAELPPLWVLGQKDEAQLVNYRVRGRYMVVDRLFDAAELRFGAKRQQRVRIVREGTR